MAALTREEARAPALDTNVRDAVLRLRALRDGGDLRAAGWFIAGCTSNDARVRNEAVSAMHEVVRRFEAVCYRWANDLDLADYRACVGGYLDDARRLASDKNERVRRFAAVLLSLEGARPEGAPALRDTGGGSDG
jgi:hypothetical protein